VIWKNNIDKKERSTCSLEGQSKFDGGAGKLCINISCSHAILWWWWWSCGWVVDDEVVDGEVMDR